MMQRWSMVLLLLAAQLVVLAMWGCAGGTTYTFSGQLGVWTVEANEPNPPLITGSINVWHPYRYQLVLDIDGQRFVENGFPDNTGPYYRLLPDGQQNGHEAQLWWRGEHPYLLCGEQKIWLRYDGRKCEQE